MANRLVILLKSPEVRVPLKVKFNVLEQYSDPVIHYVSLLGIGRTHIIVISLQEHP